MNVLSLFDGLSGGQIALDRLGIKVDNYYASEIDKYAISVAKHNYPNTVHLGDVQFVTGSTFGSNKIDLLIGGSPCQGFSFSGSQLNFDDDRSKLFFEYVRLLKELKPKYFFLENVVMKKESQDVITELLGVEPIKINSKTLSAQSRGRLYWTNIPNVTQPKDNGLYLRDVLQDDFDIKYVLSDKIQDRLQLIHNDMPSNSHVGTTIGKECTRHGQRDVVYGGNQKMGCLVATDYKQPKQVYYNNVLRKITPMEAERMQTIDENYTAIGRDEKGIQYRVSDTQRYKMIGNGWTIKVIEHIFKNID